MTVVELFDRSPLQNMLSCLRLKPEKVIFVGVHPYCEEGLKKYRKFLEDNKIEITLDYELIDVKDLQGMENVLTRIVETEKDCVFDLTGGEDLLLVAAGIVYGKFRDSKHISLQQFDELSGDILDSDNDGHTAATTQRKISIEDLITLNGGKILSKDLCKDYADGEFNRILEEIWNLAKKNPVEWNKSTAAVYAFEKYKDESDSPLDIHLDLFTCHKLVKDYEIKKQYLIKILHNLASRQIIKKLHIKPDSISYTYTSLKAKKCLAKSGNVLELKAFKEALNINEADGTPYFNDIATGVFIEWESTGHFSAKNEIDVMLMRDLIPIFISCKNGSVNETELYKLNSVAEEFGGENLRKVLIISDNKATDLAESSLQSFRERAKSMDIKLLENARSFTEERWKKEILDII